MTHQPLRRFLNEEQQAALLAYVGQFKNLTAQRDHAALRLLRDTGLRVGEFSRLTVGAARFAIQTGWIFIPKEHRKGKQRDHRVPVTAPVRKGLLDALSINVPMGGRGDDADPLFWSRIGTGMSIRAFQERAAYWGLQALCIRISPHWMRHTRGMNIVRRSTAKNPLLVAQHALGHASLSSTGIYTAPTADEIREALDEVDGGAVVKKTDLRKLYELHQRIGRAA